MLTRLYQVGGGAVLAFYAAASFLGWEFASPVKLTPAPAVNAVIVSRGSWGTGRTGSSRSSYSSSSSGGTRSSIGGGGFGGK